MATLKGTVTVNGKTFGLKAPLANDSKLVYSNAKAAIHLKLFTIIHRETGLSVPELNMSNPYPLEAMHDHHEALEAYNEKVQPIADTIKFTTIEE